MATSPFRPPVDPNDPNDPLARPNAPPSYQNTPEGRSSYLQNFADTPWFNGQLFDSYLQSHPDWTANTPYWDQRLGDAPGTGSNTPVAPKASASKSPYMTNMSDPSADLSQAGPPPSDVLAQVMAELQAQQQGGDSPRTRQVHLDLLGRK
jgi:hypothetical protein